MNSVPGSFWEWLAALGSGERTGLTVMGIAAFVFMVWMVLVTIYKIHGNRLEDALKRELLDRGMTAEEIATVVRAHPQRGCSIDSSSGEIS
jgi:hypothetical protein